LIALFAKSGLLKIALLAKSKRATVSQSLFLQRERITIGSYFLGSEKEQELKSECPTLALLPVGMITVSQIM